MTNDLTRVSDEALCEYCDTPFRRRRKDQRYCSDKCRKAAYQDKNRKENPVNSTLSPQKWRENYELFDRALRLAEMLYTMPVGERLGFMKGLIDDARHGNVKLKNILLNPAILKARYFDEHMFYKKRPAAYRTIGQAADSYCRRYWGASVRDVLLGKVAEPDAC